MTKQTTPDTATQTVEQQPRPRHQCPWHDADDATEIGCEYSDSSPCGRCDPCYAAKDHCRCGRPIPNYRPALVVPNGYVPPSTCGDKKGTLTGLRRHRAIRETACRECRDAANQAQKARYWAAKARSRNMARHVPEI